MWCPWLRVNADAQRGPSNNVEALSFTPTYNSLGLAPNKPVLRCPRAAGQGTSEPGGPGVCSGAFKWQRGHPNGLGGD